MPAITSSRDQLMLSATPEKIGETIVFSYTVQNTGPGDAYVFDCILVDDPATHTAVLDCEQVTIWRSADGYAEVLRGIAPLPIDRDVWRSIIPSAARLGSGMGLERRLVLPIPLAEQSPYFHVGHMREYRLTEIEGIRLHVETVRPTVPGFSAVPLDVAPDAFAIGAENLEDDLTRLTVSFRAKGLHLMTRIDAYPRPT